MNLLTYLLTNVFIKHITHISHVHRAYHHSSSFGVLWLYNIHMAGYKNRVENIQNKLLIVALKDTKAHFMGAQVTREFLFYYSYKE